MTSTRISLRMLLSAVLLPAATTMAHLPLFDDGTSVDAESAFLIEDPGLSQVVYHEVTEPVQPLWIAFDGVAGQELYFNPGLPAIERLRDYRPAFALVGPGLPPATLPFPIPDGMGAMVYPTDHVATPEIFDEHFSGTQSWILFEQTVTLPETGRYYLVGYVPSGQPGKFWIAVGRREEFRASAIATLPQDIARVRVFHESSATAVPCFLIPAGLAGTVLGAGFISRRRALRAGRRHTPGKPC